MNEMNAFGYESAEKAPAIFHPSEAQMNFSASNGGLLNPAEGPHGDKSSTFVRILNTIQNCEPLTVTAGAEVIADRLKPGALTDYFRMEDGFHTIIVRAASNFQLPYYRRTFSFVGGETLTLVLYQCSNRLEIHPVFEHPSWSPPADYASIRAVNLASGRTGIDLFLKDGRILFPDIRFREITAFKPAAANRYEFSISETACIPIPYLDEKSMTGGIPAVSKYYPPGFDKPASLFSFYAGIRSGGVYTVYILGSPDRTLFGYMTEDNNKI